MLILSRKINEEIKISSEITVKIISISENQVKIGIEAPEQIKILRGEMYEKLKENAVEALNQSMAKLPADLNNLKVKKLK